MEFGLLAPIHKNGCFSPAPRREEPAGLHILKSKPPLPIPTRTGMLLVPQYPFEEAIALIQNFFAAQKQSNSQFENEQVAWISDKKSDCSYYPPAFESRGLRLKDMLFLDSPQPAKTLHAVCDAGQFQVVVVVGKVSRTALQIAKKWLKPRDGPSVRKADEMEHDSSERLVIFIE